MTAFLYRLARPRGSSAAASFLWLSLPLPDVNVCYRALVGQCTRPALCWRGHDRMWCSCSVVAGIVLHNGQLGAGYAHGLQPLECPDLHVGLLRLAVVESLHACACWGMRSADDRLPPRHRCLSWPRRTA